VATHPASTHVVVTTYPDFLSDVDLAPELPSQVLAPARRFVAEKDAPVLAAARAARADVLVTGDLKHFGALMDRDDLPLRVRSPRAFLLEGA
jgi:hypothetical protein